MELKEAIDLTVRECIEENILRDFLEQHRIFWGAKVCDMCLTEFEKRNMKMFSERKAGRKDLRKVVQKKGKPCSRSFRN